MVQICSRIADGESLAAVCRDSGMPSCQSFLAWVSADSVCQGLYRAALMMRAELYADEIVELADSARGKGIPELSAVKLAVNVRQWVTSRVLPKQYGDRPIIDRETAARPDESHVDQRLRQMLQKFQCSQATQ